MSVVLVRPPRRTRHAQFDLYHPQPANGPVIPEGERIFASKSQMSKQTGPDPLPIPTSWENPLNQWKTDLRARRRSPQTVALRYHHLRRFARESRPSPTDVTEDVVLHWAANQNWRATTRNSYYASLRSFFGHFWRDNPQRDPTLRLTRVPVPRSVPKPTPEAVVTAAYKDADRRTRMLISLMAELGLRRNEAAQVHLSDIEPDMIGHSLLVHGKGGHERLLPLPSDIAKDLISLCENNGGYAFPGQVNGHISGHWAGKLVNRALGPGWNPHGLRHRFASAGYAQERDIRAVQELLGHTSPTTTMTYTRIPDGALLRTVAGARLRRVGDSTEANVAVALSNGQTVSIGPVGLTIHTPTDSFVLPLTGPDRHELARQLLRSTNQSAPPSDTTHQGHLRPPRRTRPTFGAIEPHARVETESLSHN